jgi:uncharacterized protein (TIRG00374 family)
MLGRLPGIALAFAAGLAVLAAVARAAGWDETVAALRGADGRAALLALIPLVLAYALRGARWITWERRLGYPDAAGLVLIGFMGNNLAAGRRGELLRARCTGARTRADTPAALASIAVERTLDALAVAACGIAAALRADLGAGASVVLLAASLAGASPALALLAGARAPARARAMLDRLHERFPGHLTRYARDRSAHFIEALAAIERGPRLAAALLGTVAIWTAEALAYHGFARAAGVELRPAEVLGLLAAVNLASVVAVFPGGLGLAEAAGTALLSAAGVPAPAALAAVALQHGAQLALTTGVGLALYAGGRFRELRLLGGREPAAPRAPAAARGAGPALAAARDGLADLGAGVLERPAARQPALSLVVPAFDEQHRLPRTLLETLRWCSRSGVDAEIVVVDDGSRDDTLALARLFEEQDRRIRVVACPHAGKGAAVRMGMLNALGRHVLFMDADGATPLDQIPKLRAALDDGHDLAIGSRVLQRPGEARLETSAHRRVMGRTFAFLVNLLAVPGIADTQCGFKAFRREVVREVFGRQKLPGFAFDVEVLYIASRLGLRTAEIPVDWVEQGGSKVNLVTDSIRMLRDVMRVRWLHRELR